MLLFHALRRARGGFGWPREETQVLAFSRRSPFPTPFSRLLSKKKKKKTKQIASLRPSLKAELKSELTEELSASGALVADAGPEPGPIRWIAEAFSFYRGQTVLLEETLRDTIGGAKAALLEGTLDEGPEWDIGYTSKKRCTDIEGQTKAGQRSCCIPRLQTLTWKDSLAEALVKQFGPQRAFNVTPPSFLIPEQLAEWRHWAKNNEPPGTAWVLKELRHGKVGVTILPFEEATVAAEERGDPDDDDDEEDGGEPGHRYRVAQRYLKDTMLSSALGGNFWKFFILRGQGGGGRKRFLSSRTRAGESVFFFLTKKFQRGGKNSLSSLPSAQNPKPRRLRPPRVGPRHPCRPAARLPLRRRHLRVQHQAPYVLADGQRGRARQGRRGRRRQKGREGGAHGAGGRQREADAVGAAEAAQVCGRRDR